MVIFHKDQAINMKSREFRTLVSLLTRSALNTQTPKSDGMSFNAKGTVMDLEVVEEEMVRH